MPFQLKHLDHELCKISAFFQTTDLQQPAPHLSRVTSLENNLFPKYLLKVADLVFCSGPQREEKTPSRGEVLVRQVMSTSVTSQRSAFHKGMA